MDDAIASRTIRYTRKQRARDMRTRQYAHELMHSKPAGVKAAEVGLTGQNSKAASLSSFLAYCAARHETLDECLDFYSEMPHRQRRWKTCIKAQKSEEGLYKRLEALKNDGRPLVLAYGSWGLIAGQAGNVVNKGIPPCIGVGLMRKLSRRFPVVVTPEHYTSKTCSRCLGVGMCGPWKEVERAMGRPIRGLRRCQQRDCMTPHNRDKNGATNIGTNFKRLMRGQNPIRSMTDEEVAHHRATLETCRPCDEGG
tara:strand:- start:236 stop:994 length:759 start_codon:yes stop_codon:yes gene_type:complete